MTQGRVYVVLNDKNIIKHISYYDNEHKKMKQIDLNGASHKINGKQEKIHTHKGYYHKEKGTFLLSKKEQRMVARVTQIWENNNSK